MLGPESAPAAGVTGYDITIVGGSMYRGQCSGAMGRYLRDRSPAGSVKPAVFTTTGSAEPVQSGLGTLRDQAGPLIGRRPTSPGLMSGRPSPRA